MLSLGTVAMGDAGDGDAASILEDTVAAARSKEPKERLRAVQQALDYAEKDAIDLGAAPLLVEALEPMLKDNNPKVVQGALAVLQRMVEALEEECEPYLSPFWSPLVERLGDAKTALRERAVDLAVATATLAVAPADALDRLRPAFEHKNWRARESALHVLARTLAAHEVRGAATAGLSIKSFVPSVAKLLEDQQLSVRDAAADALEQMHMHAGDVLIGELQRSKIRPASLNPILARLRGNSGPLSADERIDD